MTYRNGTLVWRTGVLFCALAIPNCAGASGVPISGFYAMMGLSLTNEFKDDSEDFFFVSERESSLVGTQLGGTTPFYDIALLDTGAAISLITHAADSSFNIQGAGFRGTNTLPLGGATGIIYATINDPMSMFLTGLGNRTSTAPLAFNTSTLVGQSSISLATLPVESDLPSIIGIPFLSRYATYIRNDQPQIFKLGGKTVRSPQVQLLPRGSGGEQGIARNQVLTLDSDAGFSSQAEPAYVFDFANIFNGLDLTENPAAPTALQAPGALFLDVIAQNTDRNGILRHLDPGTQFFLDTGADVTVVSTLNAVKLGIDPLQVPPDFTVAVIGSGGVTEGVPGYFIDELELPTSGGTIKAENVPVLVLNVPNPAHSGQIVQGILGTNILSGRNVIIDPIPALDLENPAADPKIYISDPVTTSHSWSTAAASGAWSNPGNWNASGTPDVLWIANVRNTSGGAKEAVVSANSTVWELNVSGIGAATMNVRVSTGATLTTFSGMNVEAGGKLQLDGGTLDAQYVDIRGGTLTGTGTIATGSGPIHGQVENHGGIVAPGNGAGTLNISGRFANAIDGTLAIEVGGLTPGTQHDQLLVDGAAALKGTLAVSLIGGFAPAVGNTFTILTATEGRGGVFDTYTLPNGYVWNVMYTADSVLAKVIGVGINGDFNLNGVVDAADYILWRDKLGTTYQQADLKIWRTNFGMTAGAGATADGLEAVPEPASSALFIAACLSLGLFRRRC